MHKVFLFDLDGVLINDEAIWETKKQQLYTEVFGAAIHDQMGSTLGLNMDGIYERAIALGTKISKDDFISAFYGLAHDIYETAPIPSGVAKLVEYLLENDFRIGIVSASPLSWITTVVQRLSFQDSIELIISLHDRPDLKHKPNPDGYLEAMQALESSPALAFVLEDSNSGIAAAKSSGAYTIGLKQNLIEGYEQVGADTYASSMLDVIEIVKDRIR